MNPASIPGTPPAWTRRLLRCGVAAGPVFVAVFLLEGAVRDGYRPLRHPVSSLALGPRGWIQAGNFAVAGTLVLAAAAGLARTGDPAASRAAPALIGAAGAGLIGSAVFTTDPVSGYPPGTPDALAHPTRTGIAHNLAAVPVFAGLPAAALASGWRSWRVGQHRFGLYSAGTAVTMLTTTALAGAGFGQSPGSSTAAGCSSALASSPALPGSQPCPHKRSGERPPPRHHATRQAERFLDHPKCGGRVRSGSTPLCRGCRRFADLSVPCWRRGQFGMLAVVGVWLEEISDGNRAGVLALRVAPGQGAASSRQSPESLAEAGGIPARQAVVPGGRPQTAPRSGS